MTTITNLWYEFTTDYLVTFGGYEDYVSNDGY